MDYEEKLKTYMRDNGLYAEHLSFQQSCHSVAEAAEAVHASAEDFVKNICMIAPNNSLVVCIVKGEDRVSRTKVGQTIASDPPRIATAEEILARTGYPCGGTPSFGYEATFLVDQRCLEREIVYTGGGSQTSLVRIRSDTLLTANKGHIVDIKK
jgi:Cys-tRNA(Pro)/Cys-tRNA(Cys) deacylase